MCRIEEIMENVNKVSKDILYEGINMKIHATDYCEHASFLLDEISRLTARIETEKAFTTETVRLLKEQEEINKSLTSKVAQLEAERDQWKKRAFGAEAERDAHWKRQIREIEEMYRKAAHVVEADRDHWKARAEALEAELAGYREAERDGRVLPISPYGEYDGEKIKAVAKASNGNIIIETWAKDHMRGTFVRHILTREEAERALHGPCHGCIHGDNRFDNPCSCPVPCVNHDQYEAALQNNPEPEGGEE